MNVDVSVQRQPGRETAAETSTQRHTHWTVQVGSQIDLETAAERNRARNRERGG